MGTVLEIVHLYVEFSMWVAVFFFGRLTKGTDKEVAGLAVAALMLGFGWPYVFYRSLRAAWPPEPSTEPSGGE